MADNAELSLLIRQQNLLNVQQKLLERVTAELYVLRCMIYHVAKNDAQALADARQGRMKWHG